LPAELPPYAKDKPMPAPTIVRQRLANGLAVWVVPRQGLPRVDAVLAVRDAGASADTEQQPGFAAMLAGLLTEGSTKRDARAIAQAAQALGGEIEASSGNDGITINANALASQAGPFLQLVAEVARQPAFVDGEVQLAKSNAQEALKAASAKPGFRAEGAMAKAIYGSHPYGNSQPTAAAIEATTPAALRTAHARRFRPESSLLVIAGRIDPAQALKLAQAAFGDWKATGEPLPAVAAAPTSAAPVRLLLERPGSVQATLRLGRPGAPASDPDYVPLRVTSTVLGDGFTSRINMNLREEKGYTYGASARARSYLDGGAIIGGADVRNEVAGASLKEYDAEYRRIGSELVPAEELAMTQRYMAGTFLVSNQVQGAMAATLAQQWLVGLPPEFLSQYVQRLQRVDAEQVRSIAKKYFSPETQSIVVVGDKAAVSEQLKAWGDFRTVAK
jgi:zinc protease